MKNLKIVKNITPFYRTQNLPYITFFYPNHPKNLGSIYTKFKLIAKGCMLFLVSIGPTIKLLSCYLKKNHSKFCSSLALQIPAGKNTNFKEKHII